ncbi:TraB/GumN family protein [Mucilaginibacter sp.]|uniref:TraB/GumN family protein n=1 Tax=Mucilaginibacter sp. TaxID=1882438 RepID=UPI003B00B760
MVKAQNAADAQTLLWKISGKGLQQESYILLTTTKTCEPKIKLSDKVLNVLNKVKLIAQETGLNSKAFAGVAEKANGLKNNNQSAEKSLSKNTYEKLITVAEDEGIPEIYLNQYKLWYIYMFLMTKTYQCNVPNAEKIDDVIRNYGSKHNIPVKELLSIDETLNTLYDKFPNSYWESVINYMVNNKNRVIMDIDAKAGFYKQENVAGLKKLLTSSGLFKPRYVAADAEMYRMRLIMSRIENTIKTQSTLVTLDVVDIGNDSTSILNLLSKSGYTISPVIN